MTPTSSSLTPPPAARSKLREVPKTENGASREAPPRPLPDLSTFVEPDSYSSTVFADVIDRSLNAAISRFTLGLSPAALLQAYADWAIHLAMSPGKRVQLVDKAQKKARLLARGLTDFAIHGMVPQPVIEPLPQDHRFSSPAWQQFPFNFVWQSFLLQQQWWHNATAGVPGISRQHEREVAFAARQILDVLAPSNFISTNPELIDRTWRSAGMNLLQGFFNFLEDQERALSGKRPVGADAFTVGRNVGITPGKVVYRNDLIELLQYAPTTADVRPEPILITPAWIMKYYILDLSPENSLVRFLVSQGFTVFIISWKNPGPEDRDRGMDDYLNLGFRAALDAVCAIVPNTKVHAVGYCLGGTLLSIAASAMARDGDDRLKTMSLLAAESDFTEAGELTLFIDESQINFLEDTMWEQGYLDTRQMAGAFQMLRSNDLVWSRVIHDYLMGERQPMIDLMAWNADATRLPYKMHSQYLRQLFLDNDLAEGRYLVDGKPVALNDLQLPIFAVGTEWDHVAPWRSVFKIQLMTDTEVTFVLTNGGHNAGIVSEPGHHGRHYRLLTKASRDRYSDPNTWIDEARFEQGSWWPAWVSWLDERSGAKITPPSLGAPAAGYKVLADAPGSYVLVS